MPNPIQDRSKGCLTAQAFPHNRRALLEMTLEVRSLYARIVKEELETDHSESDIPLPALLAATQAPSRLPLHILRPNR